ncbi:MAG: GHMP kinase, partial [Lentisphaerae bacterium]|nr:GHMP kinase [Lentisphaerota bacterium]
YGYYGGIRLLKAAVKRFFDYCTEHGVLLEDRNFTIRYDSNIPHLVGLAGSSAIITACLRALMAFYNVNISKPDQANLILSVEKDELLISAGLQDRVAQVYEGLMYMDFSSEIMQKQGYGNYIKMDPSLLPLLYIAYRADLSEGSDVVHNNLTERFAGKNADVLEAVRYWADLTDRVKDCLLSRKIDEIGGLLNANFDMRAKICKISSGNRAMIKAARSVGASAKFTGSGGAIIGTYEDDIMFERLVDSLKPMGVVVIKPELVKVAEVDR